MTQQTSNFEIERRQISTTVGEIRNEFIKPIMQNVFMTNYDYLLRNSQLVIFDHDSWTRRPEVFSLDHYKDPNFYQVILLVNNIGSRFAFTKQNMVNNCIIAPMVDNIYTILKQKLIV